MKEIKNYAVSSAVLFILALVFALTHSNVPRAVADEFKDVRVINSASLPAQVRDVDNPGRQPVHISEAYTVPPGRRLVIEYISFEFKTSSLCEGTVVALRSGTRVLHEYRPQLFGKFVTGPASEDYIYGLSQETRAYVDQNEALNVAEQWRVFGCLPDPIHLGISGYLVDLPYPE